MSEEPSTSPAPRSNPWWIPRFLGRVPDLADSHLRTLGVISLALLFESFDQATLTAALRQIAAEFGLLESDLGGMMGWVHLGALPAFLLVPLVDRFGRRRLFLISLIGLSLGTIASAFAPTIEAFIALQMVGRMFMVTCSATAFVIVAEEFPAEHRGWGIGILGALSAVGYGLALGAFSAIESLPYGWRAIYLMGMIPLLLLPMFRREVKETRRFQDHLDRLASRGHSPGWFESWWSPMRGLLRAYPGRASAIGLIGALASGAHSTGFSFAAYYVQVNHGWSPGEYAAMAIAAGTFGIIGHPWAGRIADRRGRRVVGFILLGSYPFLALAFYHGPGWALPLVWIPMIFAMTGGDTIQRALAAELFPTSHRGTASGWFKLCEAVGRSSGLFIVAWGTARGASNTPMISIVVFAALAAGLIVLLLPETGRRELEDVSAER